LDAIYAEHLFKTYDNVNYALSDLSLSIPQGTVFGFLGPNGAGKTTTVKILTGLLRQTSGECTVYGYSPSQNPCDVHRVSGVMTESAKMYGQLTGMENLVFFAQTIGMEPDACAQRAGELLKQLDLWDARDKKLSEYSTGMAQRLSLARALIHRPPVLFLDEPTSGLDPESAQSVNEMISSLAAVAETTVFLCTHQLRYAQDICSSYGIIDSGKLLACGDFQTLCDGAGCHIKAGFRLAEGEQLEGYEQKDGWWQTELLKEEEMPLLLQKIVEDRHNVYEARLIRPTLEEVYFQYLEHQEATT